MVNQVILELVFGVHNNESPARRLYENRQLSCSFYISSAVRTHRVLVTKWKRINSKAQDETWIHRAMIIVIVGAVCIASC